MIKLYRDKITFPLFSETIICKVTENTCIKQMSIVNVFAPIGLTWFQPALKYGQQYYCNSFQWHCHIAALDITTGGHWQQGRKQQRTSTRPTISRTYWSFEFGTSSNTSHQHTNIQMRWLPLYDGAVPSQQHPLAKHRLVQEHGQWDLVKRSWHGLWTLLNWAMTAKPSVIPTWEQEQYSKGSEIDQRNMLFPSEGHAHVWYR